MFAKAHSRRNDRYPGKTNASSIYRHDVCGASRRRGGSRMTVNLAGLQKVDVRGDIDELFSILPEYDVLIGMLRYGAHLPHLASVSSILTLLLSHMVPFMPREFFASKRLLVLDDTIYRGSEMSRMVATLLRLGADPHN